MFYVMRELWSDGIMGRICVIGVVVLILLLVFGLFRFAYEVLFAPDPVPSPESFIVVHSERVAGEKMFYLRDPATDVMYLFVNGCDSESVSVMVAADGSPLLYSEWLALTASE